MGNRAVITPALGAGTPSIYLHWNGGRDSVEAFLDAAKQLGKRSLTDYKKDIPEIAEMIARHFFGCDVGMTVYVQPYGRADSDNGDNGTYIINDDLKIVGRKFNRVRELFGQERYESIKACIVERAPIFN